MDIYQIFEKVKPAAQTLEQSVQQVICQAENVNLQFYHEQTGKKALEAASSQLAPHALNGGVVHYNRTIGLVSESNLFSSLILDLMWISKYFGEIERLNVFQRRSSSGESIQFFVTLRLTNRVIVQYTLNSLRGLKASFNFDFSSKGYNLDYDDQLKQPLVLNLSELVNSHGFQESLSTADLKVFKEIIQLVLQSLKREAVK